MQQSDLSVRAAEAKFRSNRLQTVGRSLMGAYPIADEAGFLG